MLGLAIAVMVGCKKKEPVSQSSQPGKVITTPAYEKYFGSAPPVDKGTSCAFVIYFPSSKEPGKVVPFPFFTFDEGSIKKVTIERLLGGMGIGSYQGEFITYPSGSRLIYFSKELETSTETAAAQALVLTLRQFKGGNNVRLQIESKESPLSALTKNTDDKVVRQPSPPRLLSVAAMKR